MLRFLSRWDGLNLVAYLSAAIFIWLINPSTVKAQLKPPNSIDGEVVLGINTYGGVVKTGNRLESNTATSNRIRLNLQTTLTGFDRLKIQVQSGNNLPLNSSNTGTNMTRSGYDTAKGNSTNLSLLRYILPIDPQTKLTAEFTGCTFSENLNNFNPRLSSSGNGATSRFGRYNPIYRLSTDGTGITIDRQLSPVLHFALGYSIPSITAVNSTPVYASIAQLSYQPNPNLDLGLTYAHSYHPNGGGIASSTGSMNANVPFGGEPTSANHYSLAASYKVSPQVVLAGWVGITDAHRETNKGGSARIGNYALTLTFTDLGKPGNMLGLIVGVPPKLLDRSTGVADRDTSLHLEALYKIKVNANLDITPSILLITNPEHNSSNPTIYVGSVRTTFRF
jgi:Carbohydrate-selective porin, OprB family